MEPKVIFILLLLVPGSADRYETHSCVFDRFETCEQVGRWTRALKPTSVVACLAVEAEAMPSTFSRLD